jgi:serine protease
MTEQQRELTEDEVVPDTTEPEIPETAPPDPPAETDDYQKPPDYELEDDRADFPDSAYDDVDDDDEDEPVDDEPDQDDPEDDTEDDGAD